VLPALEESGLLLPCCEDPQAIIEALNEFFDVASGKKARRRKEQQYESYPSAGARG
jgi:hypothetical protein